MSIISVFPGKGKPKLTPGNASPLTRKETYYPTEGNEGFSTFTVNAMPSGELKAPSIQQPNSNGRVYATAGMSTAGYLPISATKDNYIDLPTRSAATITPGTSPKTAVSKGRYTTGDVIVAGDANLAGKNILKGKSIFDVPGELELGLELDSFAVSVSDSHVPSEGDDVVYNSLYIASHVTSLVSKYSGVRPYRIEISQQVDSMEYGAAIMFTEIVGLGDLLVTGLTINKDVESRAYWEMNPDYLRCYVGEGEIIVYSTATYGRKHFNGTYRVILYYNKTS